MAQLPSTGTSKDKQLNQDPADDASVGGLGLIAEFGFSLTLKHLLPPDVIQPRVQVLDPGGQVGNLGLVAAVDGRGLADGHVEGEADATVGLGHAQPGGAAAGGGGGEADFVVAGFGGGEGEFARGAAALGDDAVVVVEDFVNGNVNRDALVLGPVVALVVPFFGYVVAYYEGVFGELFEEAAGGCYVDVEVEGLGHGGEGEEGEDSPHFGGCFFTCCP